MAAKKTKNGPKEKVKKAPKIATEENFRFKDEFFNGSIKSFRAQVNRINFVARFRERVSKDVLSIFNDKQREYWLVPNIKDPLDKEETVDEKELQEKPEQGGGDDTEGKPEQEAKEETQEEPVNGGQTSFD